MAIFEKDYRVGIGNITTSTVVSNIGILKILEDVACMHSDIVGFGVNDIASTHLSWILLSWKVRILKRVPYNTNLKVRTWAKSSYKFYTYRDFEVLDENNEIVCIATSKWTLFNTETGTITKITDDIIEKYQPEENKSVFEESAVEKLVEPEIYSSLYTYTIQRRDIDINKHVHNLNYLSFAYETLPEELYSCHKEFDNFEIMYKKGTNLGDTIKCFYSQIDACHYVTIKSEDNKDLHAIVKLY